MLFDLWGRGYSDAPYTYYDETLYTNQVALLLQKVGWTKTNVIGVSLGGKCNNKGRKKKKEETSLLYFIFNY